MTTRRPPRPDLGPGDRVLIQAHRWVRGPRGNVWVPTGRYRWRVVDRVVWDVWCGWQLMAEPTAPHHPSREAARDVVCVIRAADRPAPPEGPVQLDLFAGAR